MKPRLIYYIPSPPNATPELIVKRGLGDRFSDMGGRLGPLFDPTVQIAPTDIAPLARKPVKNGPDGGEGVLVSIPQGDHVLFDADAQTWVKFDRPAPLGTIWLGWWNDAKPGPDALQREKPLPGHKMSLGDGNEWIVPVARLLPASREWDGVAWTTRQRPAYAALWDLSSRLLTSYWEPLELWMEMIEAYHERTEKAKAQNLALSIPTEEEAQAVAVKDAYDKAVESYDPMDTVRILSVNYRVGPEEVSALGLIDVGAAAGHDWAVVNALVDGNELMEARAKKNASPDG